MRLTKTILVGLFLWEVFVVLLAVGRWFQFLFGRFDQMYILNHPALVLQQFEL